jgi:hypothetical protein
MFPTGNTRTQRSASNVAITSATMCTRIAVHPSASEPPEALLRPADAVVLPAHGEAEHTEGASAVRSTVSPPSHRICSYVTVATFRKRRSAADQIAVGMAAVSLSIWQKRFNTPVRVTVVCV